MSLPDSRRNQATPSFPPGLSFDAPLSSDDAAAIALWNNAQLQADFAALGLAEADLLDAALLRNLRLDLLFPVGIKPFELLLNMPMETLVQRPQRVAASQAAYDQLAEGLVQNGLNAIRDARFAHADLVQASRRTEVADQAAELRLRILQITNARLKAGDIGELETVQSRTESGIAQEQLVRFRHDVSLAEERLRLVLGVSLTRTAVRAAASPVSLSPPLPLSELVEKSLQARPDLRAIELSVTAATKRARWERTRTLWLTAQLNSKEVGSNGLLTGPGFSVELPVFHRNQGLIARADADVEVASRQYLAAKQRIAFEVAEARQLVLQSQESLARTQDQILKPLRDGTALAEEQYKRGDVAYLFVLEQTRSLIDTELRMVDFEASLRRAQAQLERSVGTR